jgi:hypothetical protein
MIELYPVEAILLSIIWLLIGAAIASAIMSVLFEIHEEDD